MSKREALVIFLLAIAIALALPFLARWFQPAEYVPDSPTPSSRDARSAAPEMPQPASSSTVTFRVVDSKTRVGLLVRGRTEVFDTSGRVVRESGNWFTDVEGRGSMTLDAGQWCRIHVSTALYEESWTQCPPVVAGATLDLGDIPMKALCHFQARIAVNGKRLESGIVKFTRQGHVPSERDVKTGSTGWAEAYLPQGRWVASAQGREKTAWGVRETGLVYSAPFELNSEEFSGAIYLGLMPGNAGVSGTVKRVDGTIVAGAHLRLDRMGPGHPSVGICRIDAGLNGSFQLGGLSAGMYALTVSYPLGRGSAQTTYAGIRLTDETQLSDLDLICPGPANVDVRVTRRGSSCTGIKVVAFSDMFSMPDDGHNEKQEFTDAQGVAHFVDLHLGEHTFHVVLAERDHNQHSWSDVTIDLQPDARLRFDIELEPGGSIEVHGRLTCNGKTLEPDDYLAGNGCYICFAGLGPILGVLSQTKADGEGNYTISGLPRGRYLVSCFAVSHENDDRQEHGPWVREVDLTSPEPARVQVDGALVTRPISVEVVLDGKPVTDSRCDLWLRQGPRLERWNFDNRPSSKRVNEKWLFEHAACGTYAIELFTYPKSGDRHLAAAGTLKIDANSPEHLNISLSSTDLAKPAKVIVVFDNLDYPPGSQPEQLQCRLFNEPGFNFNHWARAEGATRLFEEIQPDKYVVKIDGPGIDPVCSTITVEAGQELHVPIHLVFRTAHVTFELEDVNLDDPILSQMLLYVTGETNRVLPQLIDITLSQAGSGVLVDLGWLPLSATKLHVEAPNGGTASIDLQLASGVHTDLKLKLTRR